jgi:hypothetical protein
MWAFVKMYVMLKNYEKKIKKIKAWWSNGNVLIFVQFGAIHKLRNTILGKMLTPSLPPRSFILYPYATVLHQREPPSSHFWVL